MFSKLFFSNICSECKISLNLAFPLIISEMIYGWSGFFSTSMVAHLGRNELAANALVWNIFVAMILFFIGILSAVSIMVAHSYGAKDDVGIKQATQQGIVFAFILAIPMMLIILLAPYILIWSGQDPSIIKLTNPYFHSLIWTIFPINLIIVLEQFLIGVALTRIAMFISLILVPLQLLFSFIFIFGIFKMPAMGLAGLGYGIVVSHCLINLILIFYIYFSKNCSKYKIFDSFWSVNIKYFYELFRIGIPVGGMYCVELALFATIALMIGKLGTDILAAHQITFQCLLLALSIIFGLSQGTAIRVGHEVGRQNKSAIKFAVYVNMGIGFCAMFFISLLFLIFPQRMINLYMGIYAIKHPILVNNIIMLLSIAAVLQLIDCFRLISIAALRALKDTNVHRNFSIF